MESDKKILACVDQSAFAVHVADYAAWAARCVGASLELLHAIDHHPERGPNDDLSGTIGLGTQEQLLDKLAAYEAVRIAAERDQCREFLNGLRERAASVGASLVEVRQRHGRLEEVLAELACDPRLMVMGRGGGDNGTATGRLGTNVKDVLIAVHVPVLIVSDAFKEPQRVMIAFDGRPAAKRAVDMVAASPLFEGIAVHLFMCGEGQDASNKLAWAEGILRAAGRNTRAVLKPGDVASNVVEAVKEQSIEMLVMGAFGHSALRSLVFGSKTTEIIRALGIPTLLLR
ncbi:universal stress protein [Massilia sp. CT11-108]|uniref:universal stress protein n=1 Tax=Massilia sp. CT11-108 TaxID=3393900 RepID=UPI0039A56532